MQSLHGILVARSGELDVSRGVAKLTRGRRRALRARTDVFILANLLSLKSGWRCTGRCVRMECLKVRWAGSDMLGGPPLLYKYISSHADLS